MKSGKRWIVAGISAIVVAAAVACYFPYARVTLRGREHAGIDVSGHQGNIDWAQVKASGQEFAYIKATEGGDWVDDRFAANWEACGRVGMRRGAYHFFTLLRPGQDQADNFLKAVPRDSSSLPPVVDLEFSGNSARRPDRVQIIRELGIFLTSVEKTTGQPVIFYIAEQFDSSYRITQEYPRQLWVQEPLIRPSKDDWVVWQFNQFAKLPGISGHVDLDIMRY